MHGVALVSTGRTTQDVIWLDNDLTINLGGFSDQTLSEARELPVGSTLITPPVAVVSGNLVHVFGVGPDHGLYHWVYNSAARFGSRWSSQEMVGINIWSTPAVVLTGSNQIDLFCLGPERGMLHTRWNGSKWSTWEQLGGAFSSPPVVLPSTTGFDIFARGPRFHGVSRDELEAGWPHRLAATRWRSVRRTRGGICSGGREADYCNACIRHRR